MKLEDVIKKINSSIAICFSEEYLKSSRSEDFLKSQNSLITEISGYLDGVVKKFSQGKEHPLIDCLCSSMLQIGKQAFEYINSRNCPPEFRSFKILNFSWKYLIQIITLPLVIENKIIDITLIFGCVTSCILADLNLEKNEKNGVRIFFLNQLQKITQAYSYELYPFVFKLVECMQKFSEEIMPPLGDHGNEDDQKLVEFEENYILQINRLINSILYLLEKCPTDGSNPIKEIIEYMSKILSDRPYALCIAALMFLSKINKIEINHAKIACTLLLPLIINIVSDKLWQEYKTNLNIQRKIEEDIITDILRKVRDDQCYSEIYEDAMQLLKSSIYSSNIKACYISSKLLAAGLSCTNQINTNLCFDEYYQKLKKLTVTRILKKKQSSVHERKTCLFLSCLLKVFREEQLRNKLKSLFSDKSYDDYFELAALSQLCQYMNGNMLEDISVVRWKENLFYISKKILKILEDHEERIDSQLIGFLESYLELLFNGISATLVHGQRGATEFYKQTCYMCLSLIASEISNYESLMASRERNSNKLVYKIKSHIVANMRLLAKCFVSGLSHEKKGEVYDLIKLILKSHSGELCESAKIECAHLLATVTKTENSHYVRKDLIVLLWTTPVGSLALKNSIIDATIVAAKTMQIDLEQLVPNYAKHLISREDISGQITSSHNIPDKTQGSIELICEFEESIESATDVEYIDINDIRKWEELLFKVKNFELRAATAAAVNNDINNNGSSGFKRKKKERDFEISRLLNDFNDSLEALLSYDGEENTNVTERVKEEVMEVLENSRVKLGSFRKKLMKIFKK